MVHDDGEIFALRTEHVGGQRMASLQLEFNPLAFSAGQDARMDSKIMVPQANGAALNVYCFNYTTQQFDLLYTNNPGGGLLGISAPLPSSAENANGQVRIKIEFKHGGGQPKTIAIESLEIAHEG
jgi:hypothetical protein